MSSTDTDTLPFDAGYFGHIILLCIISLWVRMGSDYSMPRMPPLTPPGIWFWSNGSGVFGKPRMTNSEILTCLRFYTSRSSHWDFDWDVDFLALEVVLLYTYPCRPGAPRTKQDNPGLRVDGPINPLTGPWEEDRVGNECAASTYSH